MRFEKKKKGYRSISRANANIFVAKRKLIQSTRLNEGGRVFCILEMREVISGAKRQLAIAVGCKRWLSIRIVEELFVMYYI